MAATSFSRSSIDDEISARSDLALDESSEASRRSAIRDSIDRLESANWERNEEVDSNVEEEEVESDFRAWWRAEKRWSMSLCFFCNASSWVSDLGSSSSIRVSCDGVFKSKTQSQVEFLT